MHMTAHQLISNGRYVDPRVIIRTCEDTTQNTDEQDLKAIII